MNELLPARKPFATVAPFPGDETPDLVAILKEVKQGCGCHEKTLVKARELRDWYDGDSEKFIPYAPAEDALSWLTRPKRVSFITRQAVDTLTSHLYKPGPRARKVAKDPEVDAWYGRVAQDIQLNGLMRKADRLATLHGLCAIGVYPTGNPARPINYHLFPRQDFCYWASPDDPRVATALCTITRVDPQTVRYRLWTASHYYTFFRGRAWGVFTGGMTTARFDPGSSGPHPYGVLPFTFVTHELPTTDLETPGLGHLLAKVNRALNVDKSNLAHWVHHYARPLGFVSGVGPEWRPKFTTGGFVPLVVRHDSTEDAPVVPEAKYLESHIDIAALRDYIRGEANDALRELNIPISIEAQGDGQGGAQLASGVSIAAQDADLITYAKGRQPLFDRHETHLAALICKVAASPPGRMGAMVPALERAAADMSLRLSWPEPSIDLPGKDRDDGDTFELANELTDPIEVLMRRHGLTEPEAIEHYRGIQRRLAIAEKLRGNPSSVLSSAGTDDDQGVAPDPDVDAAGNAMADGQVAPDMGVAGGGPSSQIAPADTVQPSLSITVAVSPTEPIGVGPLILSATPSMGGWGAES